MDISDKRVLLLVSITTYRVGDFLDAAQRLGVEVCVGSNQTHILESISRGGTLTVDIENIKQGCKQIEDYHRDYPLSAIIGVDEETTLLTAAASQKLGLSGNEPEAIEATNNKFLFRNRMANSGLPAPYYTIASVEDDIDNLCNSINFPVVLKPLSLSASRGVVRVNTPQEFVKGFHLVCKILGNPPNAAANNKHILIEDYIPGVEVAVEGILTKGKLDIVAIFDKPDPLEGPYFEETIYVTPSRLSADIQSQIYSTVQKSVIHLGLAEGPVHAELRINQDGIWLIEVAARSIGGNCARSLKTNSNGPLEDQILGMALGLVPASHSASNPDMADHSTGVMMIPIPHSGKLCSVSMVEQAKAVKNITDITINIPIGEILVPPPEGNKYLGFIFASSNTPQSVENSLREAHNKLRIEIESDITPIIHQ